MKRALMTGITGQDGSYLTELLLSKVLKKPFSGGGIIREALRTYDLGLRSFY